MSYKCKMCGNEVQEGAAFCSICGTPVTGHWCPNCGRRALDDAAFCTYCGTKLFQQQPQVPMREEPPMAKEPQPAVQYEQSRWVEPPRQQPQAPLREDPPTVREPQPTVQYEQSRWVEAPRQQPQAPLREEPPMAREPQSAVQYEQSQWVESPQQWTNEDVRTSRPSPAFEEAGWNDIENTEPSFSESSGQEAEPIGDLSNIVGKNAEYYLPEFAKAERGEKCRFNWAAYLFGGFFAYYRRSEEIFWKYRRNSFIALGVSALAILVTGFLALEDIDSIITWAIVSALLGTAVEIYSFVQSIRFSKNFNREYYQHCLVQTKKTRAKQVAGTSLKDAVRFLLLLNICYGLVIGIIVASFASMMFGGTSWDDDDVWDNDDYISYEEPLSEADVIGRWDLIYGETSDMIIAKEEIDASFAQAYIQFYEDGFGEIYFYDGYEGESEFLTWTLHDDMVTVSEFGSEIENDFLIEDDILTASKGDTIMKFQKVRNETILAKNVATATKEITISDMIGTYSFDASFDTPDGLLVNFYYQLQISPVSVVSTGVNIQQYWRGMTLVDVNVFPSDLVDNFLIFEYENEYRLLTYIPASESIYGVDTIYLDGDMDMPYTREDSGYVATERSRYSYYILPSDTRYITYDDLYWLSKEEVVYARNEIYARYGYSFQADNIRNYFEMQDWYYENPNVNSSTFGTSQMTEVERANLETIQQYEKDMGWK